MLVLSFWYEYPVSLQICPRLHVIAQSVNLDFVLEFDHLEFLCLIKILFTLDEHIFLILLIRVCPWHTPYSLDTYLILLGTRLRPLPLYLLLLLFDVQFLNHLLQQTENKKMVCLTKTCDLFFFHWPTCSESDEDESCCLLF